MYYATIIQQPKDIPTETTTKNTKLVPSGLTATPSSLATTIKYSSTSPSSSVITLIDGFNTKTERPTLPPRSIKAVTAAAALAPQTLMIKSIENLSGHAKSEEKYEEEEKEICCATSRRNSNIEQIEIVNANKITIDQEQSEGTVTSKNTNTINENLPTATTTYISETEVNPAAGAALNIETANSNLSAIKEDASPVEQILSTTQTSAIDTEIKHPTENTIQSTTVEREKSETDTSEKKENRRPSVEVLPSSDSGEASSLSRNSSAGLGKTKLSKTPSFTKISNNLQSSLGALSGSAGRPDEDAISKSSDTSGELVRGIVTDAGISDKPKSASRLSERAKKKSWYNVLYPNYKSRAEDFKKLFKEVPSDERLIVDYSCALQRDILVQGRLYVSQNYVCFHANIFRWETYLTIRWKDVTSITKEKTALVIPNAISICTAKEKYFFATFTARDKAFLMLFRVWQNTLMNKQMPSQEIWQWVHNCYGDELGLTTDDEDYIDPTSVSAIGNDNESGGDSEFLLAQEDCSSFITAFSSDYSTTTATQSIQIKNNAIHNAGLSSSASSAGGAATSAVIKPSRKKSYFFGGTHKAFGNSSGSDNKASDNNSGESKTIMHAKELTLTSIKPDEDIGGRKISSSANESGSGGTSGASRETKSSTLKATTAHDIKRKMTKTTRERDEAASNSQTNLPTDVSCSSDSEENKVPFIATTECTSTHEGRQLVHTILPINVDTLFGMLFSKSKFFMEFHAARKTENLSFGDWLTDQGKKTRTLGLIVQLFASVGPKQSKVTEYQEMRECSKPGELYSIDVTSTNAGIPYADSFNVLMHYCLVRTVDDHTMMSVHAQVKYKKSIWGVVKGFIERNTWAGLEEYYGALQQSLESETCIPPAKSKGRRPRRGTSAPVRPATENMPEAQTKTEPIEVAVATNRRHAPHLPVPTTVQLSIDATPQNKHKWLSIFVIVLLCFLMALNVILLLKLWSLEERIEHDISQRARMPNLAQLQELPNSNQDWVELLRQQEILHETELKKWHKVLQTAIELLKKVSTVCEFIYKSDNLTQEIDEIRDDL